MARVRLIVAGLVAVAVADVRADRPAPTAPAAPAPPALAIPTSWQPLPAIADAMRAAIRDPAIAVDTSAAWGEPARGCYAIALTLHGGDAAIDAVADQLLVSLGAATATEIRRPPAGAAGGTLALTFTRPPYRGQLRVELARARGSTSAEAVACFANDREPDRCARACRALLGAAR